MRPSAIERTPVREHLVTGYNTMTVYHGHKSAYYDLGVWIGAIGIVVGVQRTYIRSGPRLLGAPFGVFSFVRLSVPTVDYSMLMAWEYGSVQTNKKMLYYIEFVPCRRFAYRTSHLSPPLASGTVAHLSSVVADPCSSPSLIFSSPLPVSTGGARSLLRYARKCTTMLGPVYLPS